MLLSLSHLDTDTYPEGDRKHYLPCPCPHAPHHARYQRGKDEEGDWGGGEWGDARSAYLRDDDDGVFPFPTWEKRGIKLSVYTFVTRAHIIRPTGPGEGRHEAHRS